MAQPDLTWPAANFTFTAPEGRDDIIDLPVFKNRAYTVSRWQPSPEELAEIIATGHIYLAIQGAGMPPVCLGSENEVRTLVAEYGVWKR